MRRVIFTVVAVLSLLGGAAAEEREELVPFGDFNHWLTRIIKESAIIGGDTKTLYEVAPEQEIVGEVAYTNQGGSPWATSNVYARVSGINKTNSSVFPVAQYEGEGKAAHLVTRIEKVRVLGMINISVIAAGSLYLGSMVEPIRGTKNPHSMLNMGIEFTSRPKAVRFDYKIELSGEPNRLRMTGFSGKDKVDGLDMPTMILLLQKRWEDSEGGLHASRIGTIIVNYTENQEWTMDATYPIIYGDATDSPNYMPAMNIGFEQRYALNSRGDNVLVVEEAWAPEDETPTHVVLQFASSHGGAYIGSPGNQMWVDNVRFVY